MRCNAKSKTTGKQCGAHAIPGKTKCKYHGGWSTGPKTKKGRKRIAEAQYKHGRNTKDAIEQRRLLRETLKQCDDLVNRVNGRG